MSFFKVTIFVLVLSASVFADWDNTDKQRLGAIQSDLTVVKENLSSYIGDSFSRFNSVTMMPSGGYGVMNPWLFQMAYGVELSPSHVGGSGEHWNLNPNVPTNDYLTAFGLKGGYEDNTQNYLDFIRNFNTMKSYYSEGYLDAHDVPIDNWLAMSYGMDIMNTLDSANFNPPNSGTTKTQSAMINDKYLESVDEVNNISRNIRSRLIGIANNAIGGANYTGDIFQIDFAWLHVFVQNCFNAISRNQWTFNCPWMLQKTYVFTLRPDSNNLLWPLYKAWNSKRTYIDVFIAFVCYGSVMAFIVSRVYNIVTK